MAATEGVLSVTVLHATAADFFWRQRQLLTAKPKQAEEPTPSLALAAQECVEVRRPSVSDRSA
jgi:hypothetical protein